MHGQTGSVIAEELGVPRKTLYRWMEATRRHPAEPFVGHGHLRADEQRRRDLERAVHDLAEKHAILKKRCASSPTARSKVRVHSRPPLRLPGHEDVSGAPGLSKRVLRVGGAAALRPSGPAPGPLGTPSDGLCWTAETGECIA